MLLCRLKSWKTQNVEFYKLKPSRSRREEALHACIESTYRASAAKWPNGCWSFTIGDIEFNKMTPKKVWGFVKTCYPRHFCRNDETAFLFACSVAWNVYNTSCFVNTILVKGPVYQVQKWHGQWQGNDVLVCSCDLFTSICEKMQTSFSKFDVFFWRLLCQPAVIIDNGSGHVKACILQLTFFFVNDGYNGSHWELISGWHCWWRSASMHFPSRGRKAEAWRDDARTCACCHLTDIAMLFTHQGPWFFQELTRGNAIWERKQWQNVACWRCHIQLASQPWIRVDPVFLSVLDSSLLPTVRQLTVHEVFFGNMWHSTHPHTHTHIQWLVWERLRTTRVSICWPWSPLWHSFLNDSASSQHNVNWQSIRMPWVDHESWNSNMFWEVQCS